MPNRFINTVLRKLPFDDLYDWASETRLNRDSNCLKHNCAERGATIQDFVVELLDYRRSADGGTNRNGA